VDLQKKYCVVLGLDRPFYEGKDNKGIYKYFREEHVVYGNIHKPTGPSKNEEYISLLNKYKFEWQSLRDKSKFYIIEI